MGEFRDTMQNQNIILYKLAQKHLDDDDILCEDDDNNIINQKNKVFKKNFFIKK